MRLLAVIILSCVAGCAHIPQESVTLSSELSVMIRSAQRAHLELIDAYVQERRQQVDWFLREKWEPQFLATALAETGLWELLEQEASDEARGQLLLEFSRDAIVEIDRRRQSLYEPLEHIRLLLRAMVAAHYEDMFAANLMLTRLLRSGADITTEREDILRQFGLDPHGFLPLDEINEQFDRVREAGEDVEEIESLLQRIVDILTKER